MAMFAAFPSTIMDSTMGGRLRAATVVEAAEGRLHNSGWEGGKQSHTSNPRSKPSPMKALFCGENQIKVYLW